MSSEWPTGRPSASAPRHSAAGGTEHAQVSPEARARPSLEERERLVLEERARLLARSEAPPAWGAAVEVVTFSLGRERYALETKYLLAVSRLQTLSPIPGAPPPIFGVTPWRGDLLTVMDLHQLLGLPRGGLSDLSRVLVLGAARAAFGILADTVSDLVTLPLSAIRSPPEGVVVRREYLRGITGEALLVLDAAELLQLQS